MPLALELPSALALPSALDLPSALAKGMPVVATLRFESERLGSATARLGSAIRPLRMYAGGARACAIAMPASLLRFCDLFPKGPATPPKPSARELAAAVAAAVAATDAGVAAAAAARRHTNKQAAISATVLPSGVMTAVRLESSRR